MENNVLLEVFIRILANPLNKTKGGVIGGHNSEAFFKYFSDKGQPVKEIAERKIHPDFEGLSEMQYQVGKMDKGKYLPDEWTTQKYTKTVYDPKVYSDDDILGWAKEALEGKNIDEILTPMGEIQGYYVKGTALNGMKFEGWFDKDLGILKSFYPVFEWGY